MGPLPPAPARGSPIPLLANPARVATLLVGLGVPALLAPEVGRALDRTALLLDGAHVYPIRAAPALCHLWAPLVGLSAMLLVLGPGLLLGLLGGRARRLGPWILRGFLASLLLVSVLLQGLEALRGQALAGRVTAQLLLGLDAVLLACVALRARAGRLGPGPLAEPEDRRAALGLLLAVFGLLSAFAGKTFFESWNGDGSHAFEAARLLLHQALPFWPAGAGEISAYPDLSDALYLYPISWFLRLFGPIEAGARIPAFLFLAVLHAALLAVAEAGRERRLRGRDHLLLGLGSTAFFVVLATSATYDPYSTDLALPATQNLLLGAFLLATWTAHAGRCFAGTAACALASLLTSPNGLLVLALALPAIAASERPTPWRGLVRYVLALALAAAVAALIPRFLDAIAAPMPGGEHDPGLLLRRFRWIQLTEIRRVLWLLIPCGIFPVLALLRLRRIDPLARALALSALTVFALYYTLAFVALHYFAPAAVLLLAAWARSAADPGVRRPRGATALAAASGLLALVLALPATPGIATAGREVGSTLDVADCPGYASMDPAFFRASELLSRLFPKDFDEEVPDRLYGGAPLVWAHYAQRAGRAAVAQYALHRDGVPPPGFTTVASEDGFAVSVRDPARWAEDRRRNPRAAPGSPLFRISRDILFRRHTAHERFAIIDLRSLLVRIGVVDPPR